MPSATPELRAEWPDGDQEAMKHLEDAGYKLTRGTWEWIIPAGHEPTEREISAMWYLVTEWDFGGFVEQPNE